MKRILVTGAGGPAGVNFIRSLRAAPEPMHIVGCDANRFHLEWPDVDAAYEAPRCDDPAYLQFLQELIARERIELVHPQPDVEVRFVSEHRDLLPARVALPAPDTIRLLQDKHASGERWAQAGIAGAPSLLIDGPEDLERAARELGLPFWLRATEGAGGIGSTPVDDVDVAVHWMAYWRGRGKQWRWVAQQMLPGANLAFTSLWDDGELVTSQVRERREYIYPYLAPSGVTGTPVDAVTVDRPDVDELATRAVLAVDPRATGVFCVDLKEDGDGVPRPTEVNCGRFFTTSHFFTAAGINIPHLYVRLAYGEALPSVPRYCAVEPGLHWVRHMDCPAVLRRDEDLRAAPLTPSLEPRVVRLTRLAA
jgi:carbamoyl-phosphate synthase large subunit